MAALEKSIGQADRSPILNAEIFIRRAKYATKNISFIADTCDDCTIESGVAMHI
jgi:hypothetical protein